MKLHLEELFKHIVRHNTKVELSKPKGHKDMKSICDRIVAAGQTAEQLKLDVLSLPEALQAHDQAVETSLNHTMVLRCTFPMLFQLEPFDMTDENLAALNSILAEPPAYLQDITAFGDARKCMLRLVHDQTCKNLMHRRKLVGDVVKVLDRT
eukprot:10125216-Lingulodinium_polyedra.AAC.1